MAIVLLSDDLMDGSRVAGSARAASLDLHIARTVKGVKQLIDSYGVELLILDLANSTLNVVELLSDLFKLTLRPKVIAYGPHVETAELEAARTAGCDLVLPRSAFFQKLESDPVQFLKP